MEAERLLFWLLSGRADIGSSLTRPRLYQHLCRAAVHTDSGLGAMGLPGHRWDGYIKGTLVLRMT